MPMSVHAHLRIHDELIIDGRKELKLESARPGVISNSHLFKSQNYRNLRDFSFGEHKTTEQIKYSQSLMSISLHVETLAICRVLSDANERARSLASMMNT